MEAFSRSTHGEDDEKALKWAALQRLPTYKRLRKGFLTSSRGEANEVEVEKLGLQERKRLMKNLMSDTELDNERLLLKLKKRLDRVGIDIPTIEVRFEHLRVEAEAYIGDRALPTLLNFFVNLVEGFLANLHIVSSKKKQLTILHDVSGIIKPSKMTLLLGLPGSGKTTLLMALAGRLASDFKVSGKVTYNGYSFNEFVPQRTSAYVSQNDVHIPEMTVREILAFSARYQGVGFRHELMAELTRREKEANILPDPDIDVFMKAASLEGQKRSVITDYVLKVLGLDFCADTRVGDEMIKGISGGQKKRLTTGEIICGSTKVLFMDDISTGLDSSTTFQVVNSMKQYVHILNGTAIISLLQPAPETFELFDDIILLSEGQIVYQGPCQQVLEFFEFMGFKCPERKGVADYLQEVTSRKDQQQYWAEKDKPYTYVTVAQFAEAFKSFNVGRKLGEELSVPFEKSKCHPAVLVTKKYGIGYKQIWKACFDREVLLMKRNVFVHIFKLMQIFLISVISMSLFFRTEMPHDSINDGQIYMGALFNALVVCMFNGMSELPLTIAKLPVFYKQRDLLFFPAWAYALPATILKIAVSFVEVALWVFTSYYVTGYDPSVKRFFKQYLALVLANQVASALFRLIAAVARSLVVSNTFGSFVLLILYGNDGFILSRHAMKKWWKWAYWISPMMYGQNALAVNEFRGKNWDQVVPFSGETLGVLILKLHGFFPYADWYWIGVAALIGFILVFNFLYVLALTYLNPLIMPRAAKPQVSESNEEEFEIRNTPSCENLAANGSESMRVASQAWNEATDKATCNKRKKVVPFNQYVLTFDEIVYSVDMPEEMKSQGVMEDKLVLLKGVSGAFKPGVLTALMGVSGAGKTTLLDVLSGRKTGGYIEGSIKVSGYMKKQETFTRISGYCEQNDIHSPHVTVFESLLYSAWLRLGSDISKEARKMFVEEILELVELDTLRQAIVGLPGVNGLSTEQRKRLTIAVELVANPSIIFLDEPTSGLDARAAAIVMRAVRNTVDTGRTVVCTIHQPSIDIFEAFDELLLLKRGETIYVGPLGHRSFHLIKYFEGIEGTSKINEGQNPATWMLEVTSSTQEMVSGVDFAELFKKSELYRRNKEIIKELSEPPPASNDIHFQTKYSQPFSKQYLACLWKQHLSYWRNPSYIATKFLFTLGASLILGTMFWNLGSKRTTYIDMFNSIGAMYTASLFLGIQNAGGIQPVVSIERTVYYRERAAGIYSGLPYALAQVTIELPYIFSQSLMYCIIVYAMMGYEWSFTKVLWFFFFMFFTFLYFTYYGMMTIAATPSYHIGMIISTAFYGMWNLFCGFIIPRTRIPVWWRWFYWTCPLSWTLYGLIGSQFGDVEEKMDTGETVEEFIREFFGFRHDFLGVVAAVIIGFGVFFAFSFAICIKFFNFQKR
ncbi:pleiotropic drug resistance protein 1-like isoform X1 [Cucurbita moschata]|uniref:Pleiotropic drug resistance protein 1-like isoform X1 n=2 Tax=Cucurbita moschata TaxID=3662 RepID=A0A6J1H5W8_CUCMO|nr:pleiotropic drug resistance protein 1-like isoform X1 [Cucurbita moschata]XP_022959811.1 pleiotropic drug resistance protein 1-like isoform X1 [Cucurbita moschata]